MNRKERRQNAQAEIEREKQLEAIEEVADKVGGTVRNDYSGRGMFGKRCYGIVCPNFTDCIEKAAARGLKGAKVDNMGLDWIVYWEHIAGD